MAKVIEALKSLERCTGLQIAGYLSRKTHEVIIDLTFLPVAGRADCVNRSEVRTKPVKSN